MSFVYTITFVKQTLACISTDRIKSYEETLQSFSKLWGRFRQLGLADMCWNLRKCDFKYSTLRMLVHKYNYRFKNTPAIWSNLTEQDKEALSPIMHEFESRTNLLCGLQYDFYLGKKLTFKDMKFICPHVYFLPVKLNGAYYLGMISRGKERVYFTQDKSKEEYNTKIVEWQSEGVYSLNKLIAAIQDRRLLFSLDNEVLVESDYEDKYGSLKNAAD